MRYTATIRTHSEVTEGACLLEQKYTVYHVRVQNNMTQPMRVWEVKRRYSEFLALDEKLRSYQLLRDYKVPTLPEKRLFKLSDCCIQERMSGLDEYLAKILADSQLAVTKDVQDFLTLHDGESDEVEDDEWSNGGNAVKNYSKKKSSDATTSVLRHRYRRSPGGGGGGGSKNRRRGGGENDDGNDDDDDENEDEDDADEDMGKDDANQRRRRSLSYSGSGGSSSDDAHNGNNNNRSSSNSTNSVGMDRSRIKRIETRVANRGSILAALEMVDALSCEHAGLVVTLSQSEMLRLQTLLRQSQEEYELQCHKLRVATRELSAAASLLENVRKADKPEPSPRSLLL